MRQIKVEHEEKTKKKNKIERNTRKKYNNIHIIHIILWFMTDFFFKWETTSHSENAHKIIVFSKSTK